MSNYIEYNDRIAFHPGYYIKEIIEDSGITQEDFAKRLDTTAKNLSLLIRGEQSLSIDMATKLSRMMGTSVSYWLNLQREYDAIQAEQLSDRILEEERKVFRVLDYAYFISNYGLPRYGGRVDDQIGALRKFLNVSTLTVLLNDNLAVSFRTEYCTLTTEDKIKSNTMVQIATNVALNTEAERFNKKKFSEAVDSVLMQTYNHDGFYLYAKEVFAKAGVKLVAVPNLPGSKTNGATKKIGDSIMLMINDRGSFGDSLWFTMFHEIGHIMNGDFGVSIEQEKGEKETIADKYARNALIPDEQYKEFTTLGEFSKKKILTFADSVDRDPGIVVGRLVHDKFIKENAEVCSLRKKYRIRVY